MSPGAAGLSASAADTLEKVGYAKSEGLTVYLVACTAVVVGDVLEAAAEEGAAVLRCGAQGTPAQEARGHEASVSYCCHGALCFVEPHGQPQPQGAWWPGLTEAD